MSRLLSQVGSVFSAPIVGGGGGGIITPFFSPTFTPIGNTHADLLGSDWDAISGANPSVVGANISLTGLGFPSEFATGLRVTMEGTNAMILTKNSLYERGPSASHYGRVYIRVDQPSSPVNHVLKYGTGIGSQFPIQCAVFGYNPSATTYLPRIRTYWQPSGEASVYPYGSWMPLAGTPLSMGTVYRYEWHFEFLSTTTYRIHPRWYLGDTMTIVLDGDTIYQADATPPNLETKTMNAFYAGGGTFGILDVDVEGTMTGDSVEQLGLGNEGPFGAPTTGEPWYYTGLQLAYGNWIGA